MYPRQTFRSGNTSKPPRPSGRGYLQPNSRHPNCKIEKTCNDEKMIKKAAFLILSVWIVTASLSAQAIDCYETIRSTGLRFLQEKNYGRAIDQFWLALATCEKLDSIKSRILKNDIKKAQTDWISELKSLAKREKESADQAKKLQADAETARGAADAAYQKLKNANEDLVRFQLLEVERNLQKNKLAAAADNITNAKALQSLPDSVQLAFQKVSTACFQLAFYLAVSGETVASAELLNKIGEMKEDKELLEKLSKINQNSQQQAQRLLETMKKFFPAQTNILLERYLPSPAVKIPSGLFKFVSGKKEAFQMPVSEFWLAEKEVTFFEFDLFCDATHRPKPDDHAWGRGAFPVVDVSWLDAVEFCNWRSKQDGLTQAYKIKDTLVHFDSTANGYRLPTEAEWQFAAGNGEKQTRFSWGNDSPDPAGGGNVCDETAKSKFPEWKTFAGYSDGFAYTAPTGSFLPNELGLRDMSGNVWEWCWDEFVSPAEPKNSKGMQLVPRVLKGGSWGSFPSDCQVANRFYALPSTRNFSTGFRLARNRPPFTN